MYEREQKKNPKCLGPELNFRNNLLLNYSKNLANEFSLLKKKKQISFFLRFSRLWHKIKINVECLAHLHTQNHAHTYANIHYSRHKHRVAHRMCVVCRKEYNLYVDQLLPFFSVARKRCHFVHSLFSRMS